MGKVTEDNQKWAEGLLTPFTFTDEAKEEVINVIDAVYEDGKIDGGLEGIRTDDITRYLKEKRNIAFQVWQEDDVIHQAKQSNITLSKEEVDNVISLLNSEADAGIGINWEVISIWIDHVVSERK